MSWDPSPGQRKLVFACVVVALAAFGVYLTAPGLFGRGSAGESPTTTSTRAAERVPEGAPTASPTATPSTSSPTASASSTPGPYATTVLRFAREFTHTDRSAEAWHDAVAPYCTGELAEGLSYTDPRTVPDGSPTGETRLVATDENAVQVAVPLDSDASILVTVTRRDGGYAVSDVRPGKR